jgi:predicted metalloprotease with PDZ domain
MTPQDLAAYQKLVAETGELFGARHYRHYDFLLTLSDQVGGHGLEHHESNDSATSERMLLDPDLHMLNADLLPHEFTHSWNGKYRRPCGLATPNYQEPMIGDLLWVYEGLTQYLGTLLAERSGLWTDEQYREALARTAAELDHETGRTWRPLEDTARSVQMLRFGGAQWRSWRREPRLLSREPADLAGSGCDHPAADARPALAERFLPALLRRRERSAESRAVYVSMTWCAR